MSEVFLIPTFLSDEATTSILPYTMTAIRQCQVIFAENERTARRFLKSMDKTIVIDDFTWFTIHKVEEEQKEQFVRAVKSNQNIAILSEAGCPGIADPGQKLIALAQEMNCTIKPLVGPNSIVLALMASGMNGQQFEFVGYLPIEQNERIKRIKELESASGKYNSTKIFIETPYRNNALLENLLQHCSTGTQLCLGINLTAKDESILTKPISEWRKSKPDLNKLPVIFLLYAGKN